MSQKHERIVVYDFGSQYSQLIARRIRECHVFSQVVPFTTKAAELKADPPSGIILSGGPASVYAAGSPQIDADIFSLGIPVLGICYGMQLLIHTLGGQVAPSKSREYGRAEMHIKEQGKLFAGVKSPLNVWMSHGDKVLKTLDDTVVLASTANTENAAIALAGREIYGIQFHPEVVHTENGMRILENFCRRICGCSGDWSMSTFIADTVESIRRRVGSDLVILGLSGGVDSSVAAALIHKAIGTQLNCIFVNNGMLRKNEPEQVEQLFGENFQMKLYSVNASERFLEKLAGIEEPEQKRKIIGREFIEVFANTARSIGEARFLAQGTTYPDVIESISINGNPSAVIKSHHNVGGLPADLKFELLEPLACLFKDEVREVGRQLGLPEQVLMRQPFPGPGLAVRHLGAVTRETLAILREADAVFTDEIFQAGLYEKIWQAFAIFIPMRTVGVMGDLRTYDYIIALRAVESQDGMTADWVNLPHPLLQRIANRIINEVRGVNRVVYDITSKPPATIEWE
ncbi:MAG: glutamine-hydrolyzing GMP synthase [Lentisphaeria bacterium]|nr:glutamine-hydrolyzing GMP synthase [Lentisphaeria bacterium]